MHPIFRLPRGAVERGGGYERISVARSDCGALSAYFLLSRKEADPPQERRVLNLLPNEGVKAVLVVDEN